MAPAKQVESQLRQLQPVPKPVPAKRQPKPPRYPPPSWWKSAHAPSAVMEPKAQPKAFQMGNKAVFIPATFPKADSRPVRPPPMRVNFNVGVAAVQVSSPAATRTSRTRPRLLRIGVCGVLCGILLQAGSGGL